MKLTKYEHACFTVRNNDQVLIVDPGNMTGDLVVTADVVGIIVTHEHNDHFDKSLIEKILAANPNLTIFTNKSVAKLLEGFPVSVVMPGSSATIGSFELEFFGGEHLKTFDDSVLTDNVAVLISNTIYYAGDSFAVPNKKVTALLLPVSGSWMKSSMSRDYLNTIKPAIVVPTHDAILSELGKRQVDKYWPTHAETVGARYVRSLEPIEVTNERNSR